MDLQNILDNPALAAALENAVRAILLQQQQQQTSHDDQMRPDVGPSPGQSPSAIPQVFAQNVEEAFRRQQEELNALRSQLASSTPAVSRPAKGRRYKANEPDKFTGSRDRSTDFLLQLRQYFDSYEEGYLSEIDKINMAGSYLRGQAYTWYRDRLMREKIHFASFSDFIDAFNQMYGQIDDIEEKRAERALAKLSQTRSCDAYAKSFMELILKTDTNERVRINMFKKGLKIHVQDHLLGRRDLVGATLGEIVQASIDFDELHFELHGRAKAGAPRQAVSSGTRSAAPSATVAATSSGPAPMEIDSTKVGAPRKLTETEKKHRRDNGLCLFCGNKECAGAKDVEKCPKLLAKNGQRKSP